jgi:integrase
MVWEDIKFESKGVVVRAAISKIRIRRDITLSDNAVEWLKVAASAAPTGPTGPIVPFSYAVRRDTCTENWSAVCDTDYPKNSARHTFISCWLAIHHDQNKLALMAGHTKKVMFQEYVRGVDRQEAERFFNIYPPKP